MGRIGHVGCYIHVNNTHYADVIIFKWKIKRFKNRNPTRKREGNILGHIGKRRWDPVFGEEESEKWFGPLRSSQQTVDQWSLLTNSADASKLNILCITALLGITVLFYAILTFFNVYFCSSSRSLCQHKAFKHDNVLYVCTLMLLFCPQFQLLTKRGCSFYSTCASCLVYFACTCSNVSYRAINSYR